MLVIDDYISYVSSLWGIFFICYNYILGIEFRLYKLRGINGRLYGDDKVRSNGFFKYFFIFNL